MEKESFTLKRDRTSSIKLKKEKLRKHEWILPLLYILLIIGSVNSIFKFKEVTRMAETILWSVSAIIVGTIILLGDFFMNIRVNRLYNTILLSIPSAILIIIYFWLINDQGEIKNNPGHSMEILKYPLYFLITRHLFRIIHIIIFRTEPLAVTKRLGASETDPDIRDYQIPGDKLYTGIQILFYFLFIWYSS